MTSLNNKPKREFWVDTEESYTHRFQAYDIHPGYKNYGGKEIVSIKVVDAESYNKLAECLEIAVKGLEYIESKSAQMQSKSSDQINQKCNSSLNKIKQKLNEGT